MTDPTTTAARVAPFPKLLVADWQPTRDTLHMWLQIVGKVKLVLSPPINHWWHSTLRVTARGLAAAAIPVLVRGKCSPVHFFWGALGLAVTQFSGRDAPVHPGGAPNCPDSVIVEGYSEELSSAGFWPGGGDEGAFYAYAYPAPDGYDHAAMPQAAGYSEAHAEFLLPAEAVRIADDPDALVQDFLHATARAAAELGHWPERSGSEAGR